MTEFAQPPFRWAWEHNVEVLNPTGWDDKDWLAPITEEEFLERLSRSTRMDLR